MGEECKNKKSSLSSKARPSMSSYKSSYPMFSTVCQTQRLERALWKKAKKGLLLRVPCAVSASTTQDGKPNSHHSVLNSRSFNLLNERC